MNSALEICKLAVSILFNCSKLDLPNFKKTFIDAEASLLSELSQLNTEIRKVTIFHRQLIQSQYIDYLKDEIVALKQSSLDSSTISSFNNFITKNREISSRTPNNRLSMDLSYVGEKLTDMVDSDILKSQALEPILKSKSHDFLLLLNEEIDKMSSKSEKIRNRIKNCELFIEAISLCEYIYLTEIDKRDGIPVILENGYDELMSQISIKYSKWKGLI